MIILCFSCGKKQDSLILNNNVPFSLLVGDTKNSSLAIIELNSSILPDRDTLNLDLDNDHVADIQFQALSGVTFGGMLLDFSFLSIKNLNSNLRILMTSNTGDVSFQNSYYTTSLEYGTIVNNGSPFWRSGTSLLYEVYMKSYTYPQMIALYDTVGYWYNVKNKYLAFELNGNPGWIELSLNGVTPIILESAILKSGK